MPWKPEYAERRRARYQADPAERERRKNQGRDPEENREYMRKYYAENPEKWRNRDVERRRELRRIRYASDPEYRERCKAAARSGDPAAKRDARLRRQFGISAVEFDAMLERQGGGCAVCGAAVGDGAGRRLAVDHCHDSGRVRGILCASCNLGIGKFRDDSSLLRSAADYLDGSCQ